MQERYWSTKKGEVNPQSLIGLICKTCSKKWITKRWMYLDKLRHTKGRGPFCSPKCAMKGRNSNLSPESILKIIRAQKGISVISRGRKNYTHTQETKDKIRQAKLGVPCKQDYEIVLKEAKFRHLTKYANLTRRPVPDIVYVEDGKLVAIEVEKKEFETAIRKKMKAYEEVNSYDKVIIVWYHDGFRIKEWILENGEWTITLG